jgi:magnesium-transporting ATPase (P-type)
LPGDGPGRRNFWRRATGCPPICDNFASIAAAVQILWVNMITTITLGLALAFEPTERGTMARPPRRRDEPILSGGLLVLVAFLFEKQIRLGFMLRN